MFRNKTNNYSDNNKNSDDNNTVRMSMLLQFPKSKNCSQLNVIYVNKVYQYVCFFLDLKKLLFYLIVNSLGNCLVDYSTIQEYFISYLTE